MPSAKKDRVTISLHLDRRLYILMKRCSEFEKQPMSRIVDKVLEPFVEKYESETLEGMENLDSVMKQVRAEKEEKEFQEMMEAENTPESQLEGFARQLAELEANKAKYNMPESLLEQFREHMKSETTKAERQRIEELKELQKAKSQRWLEITEKYPLPEGSRTFTVTRRY